MSELTTAPELVDPSASPEPETEATETTPEPTDDGQQAQEATPEVKTYEIEIDGEVVQATAEQIATWRTDATNMSAMSASATQKYQEAAKLREEYEAKLNDPEYKQLKNIDTMIRENPDTLAEFQRLSAYFEGRGPQMQRYQSPINTRLAYENTTLKSQMREQELSQRKAEVLSQVEAFRAKHEGMSDEQFGTMYEAIKAEVAPEVLDSPNFGDVLDFYHYKHFGEVENKVAVAEARDEGANEAERRISEGKAVGGVTPAGHVSHDWTPSEKLPGLESSRRAAMDDPDVQFSGTIDD